MIRAGLSIREIASILLPVEHRNGRILMLYAFLDDSGTHNHSPVVVVGGLIGTEAHWSTLDAAWREKLRCPLIGKPRLASFSLFDCHNAVNEFQSYSRPESDLLTAEFRAIIKAAGVIGYGSGMDKTAFDELVTAGHRQFMGPAETFCVTRCVRNMLSHTAEYFGGSQKVAVIYDQGRRDTMGNRLQNFDWSRGITDSPEVTSFAYAKVQDHPGLQAADMIATEYFWWLKSAKADRSAQPRPHFQDYIRDAIGTGDFWNREQIERELSFRNPDGSPKPNYPRL